MTICKIGFIAAMQSEAESLRTALATSAEHPPPLILVGGPGRSNAARAANEAVRDGCNLLVSWGLAGGLVESLRPGNMIAGEYAFSETGTPLHAEHASVNLFAERMRQVPHTNGNIITTTRAVRTPNEKAALSKRYDVIAADLESSAIAYVARSAKVGFYVLRSIIDPAEATVPLSALVGLDDSGRTHILPVLKELKRRPHEIRDMLKMARLYKTALGGLATAANALLR